MLRPTFPRTLLYVLSISLLYACATTPKFKLDGVIDNVSPTQSATQLTQYQGKQMLWGGVIVNSTNTKQGTQLEILAYPLDGDMRPLNDTTTQGRFLGDISIYLETADYAPGRLITVVGTLTGTQKGKIGDAVYHYPVLQIGQHYLWPKHEDRPVDTSVHFGIGVIFH